MKALLILKDHQFNPNRFNELAGAESQNGYEIISSSVFLFELALASHLLANIQSWLNDQEKSYHVIYLPSEPVMFQYPNEDASNFANLVG